MGDEKLRRRIPVLRKMGFMRYHGLKDLAPARNITFNRCWHGKLMALPKRTIRHRIESATCTHTMCRYPSRSCRQPCAAICRSRSGQYRLALGVVPVAVVMPLPGESPRECGGSGSRSRRWTDHVWSAEVSAPAFPAFPGARVPGAGLWCSGSGWAGGTQPISLPPRSRVVGLLPEGISPMGALVLPELRICHSSCHVSRLSGVGRPRRTR